MRQSGEARGCTRAFAHYSVTRGMSEQVSAHPTSGFLSSEKIAILAKWERGGGGEEENLFIANAERELYDERYDLVGCKRDVKRDPQK
jgi:hypothetical protein